MQVPSLLEIVTLQKVQELQDWNGEHLMHVKQWANDKNKTSMLIDIELNLSEAEFNCCC